MIQKTPARSGPWFRLAVSVLFFASGASGLMYETAWSRLFQDLFGHGVHTNAAVLAAFMAGLGLGAAVGGRWADRVTRPLVVYAVFETAIALVVWTSPWQVGLADRLRNGGFVLNPDVGSAGREAGASHVVRPTPGIVDPPVNLR